MIHKVLVFRQYVSHLVFFFSFLQQICSSASYYADLLFEKMIKNNYYDQDPSQFGVSEEVTTRKFIKRRFLINFAVRFMKTVRIKTKYKTSLSSYWAFLFKERWRHFNFHYGFCRKARVIKCSPFIIAKMGLMVPGVP